MSSSSPYISKTEFLDYLTCPGFAWHKRHNRDTLPPLEESALRRMRDGNYVERRARELFPTGRLITARHHDSADTETRGAIDAGVDVLFQATALAETGLIARADILERLDDGWHLIEIKSSSADPDKPRNVIRKHLDDLTFQSIAFRHAGIPVVKTSLLVLNRSFRRNGEIRPDEMFTLVDATNDVNKAHMSVHPQVEEAINTLLNSRVAAECDCHRKTRTNRCELFSYFHPHIPERGTIYNIGSISRKTLLPALDRGILMIEDWPDDIELGAKQRRQVELARAGEEVVNAEAISTFLASHDEPIWYLDYETFQNSVPRWDGYAPHQQITFQYSLHWRDGNGGESHYEYLAESASDDPTEGLLAKLSQDMGDTGSVLVWNRSFEFGRNVEMAERFPQYADFLHGVNARMIDLADAVKHGWWEHPDFQGSWSLKQVLPVAAPEMDYKNLVIGDGSTASERWMQAVLDNPSPLSDNERADVLRALQEYCKQDTLAMVRIRDYMLGLLN